MKRPRPSVRIWAILGLGLSFLPGMIVLRADALISGTDSLIWPPTAAVGTTFRATLDIVNRSTPSNDTERVGIESLFVTPACASASLVVCSASDAEQGVFDVRTAVGNAGTTPCAGVAFSIGSPDPVTGEIQLIPSSAISLGPSTGPEADRTCRVDLELRVNKLPVHPDGGIPGRTNALSRTVLRGETSALKNLASGVATITVTSELSPLPVPTLSGWVIIMLAFLLMMAATVALRRRAS